MANGVKFEDNSIEVNAALNDAVMAFLHEAAGEVTAATQRNSRKDTGQTMGSYEYIVEKTADGAEARIGSGLENAIWEEFGTGEHALNNDGRKGGWRYKDKKGKWHFTVGKRPQRPMFNAYTSLRGKIINRAEKVIGIKMK